jgi:O-antigen ligase
MHTIKASPTKQNSVINTTAGILILLFPAFLVALPDGGAGILILLVLVSIVGLIKNRGVVPLHPDERYFLYAVGLFLLVYAFNIWFFGVKISAFDNPSRFLLLLPVFFYLRKIKLNLNYLIFSLFLGTLSCIVFAIYQKYFLDIPRAHGVSGVVTFALISVTLAMMSLSVAMLSSSKWLKSLMLLSFFFGVSASIMSGTRGAWLALPVGVFVLLLINPLNWKKQSRIILSLISICVLGAAYFLPFVQMRIDTAISGFMDYFSNDDFVPTSVGWRLELWRGAAIAIFENPVLGIGEGKENFRQTMQHLADAGSVTPTLATSMPHVHNEFISATLHRGILGLFTLLLIFFLPLVTFIKSIKTASGDKKILMLMGVMLTTSCATTALSDAFFHTHALSIFYVTFIYVIYTQIHSRNSQRIQ